MYSIELQFVYATSNGTKCYNRWRGQDLRLGQWPNSTQSVQWYNITMWSIKEDKNPRLLVYIMWPHWRRQSPTSVIPWKLRKSSVCEEFFVPGRNQQSNQLSVLWNFSYPDLTLHTLRLVSPWGCPGTYPVAQYTAYSPERPPYMAIPSCLNTVCPAYTAHSIPFRQSIPYGTQGTQPTGRPPYGPDYKPLQVSPAYPSQQAEHNAQRYPAYPASTST